jgi:hypothetical protein
MEIKGSGEEMKKGIQLLAVMLVGVLACFLGYTRIEAQEPVEKLEKMIAVVEANGATVEQWSWLAKEELDSVQDVHTFYKLLDSLAEKKVAADWKVEQSPEGYKAIAVKKFTHYQERLVVTWAKENTKDETFITYEVKGTEWDDAILKKMHKIFRQNPATFTCVQAVFDDKIEGVLQNKAAEILKDLSATPIESLEEIAFVSVSAYTEEWKDALAVNREKMNVQVALRNTDNKTTVVVCTPIITSEY